MHTNGTLNEMETTVKNNNIKKTIGWNVQSIIKNVNILCEFLCIKKTWCWGLHKHEQMCIWLLSVWYCMIASIFYSSLFAWKFISIVSLLVIACILLAIGYSKCFKGTKTPKIYPKITIVAPQAGVYWMHIDNSMLNVHVRKKNEVLCTFAWTR